MSLGVITKKTYLNIRDGKVILKENGSETIYDYVEGHLKNITIVIREFNREKLKFWNIELLDSSGELYVLSVNYSSGVAKSILNSLAFIEGEIENVRITPYLKDGYTKAVVHHNGEKLKWKYDTFPEVDVVRVGDKEVKDDTKRMKWFEELTEGIVKKISLR